MDARPMDAKLKLSRTTSEVTRKKAFSFIQEFKEELKKVSWTTKSELTQCTKIVIGAIFSFGLGIYLIDIVIKNVLDAFSHLMHLIFG